MREKSNLALDHRELLAEALPKLEKSSFDESESDLKSIAEESESDSKSIVEE